MAAAAFQFKRFRIEQNGVAHPMGTDGVLLGSWATVLNPKRILDIGTGTGIVALFLAQRAEKQGFSEIIGIDVHEPSAACAARNFRAAPWSNSMVSMHMPVQSFCQKNNKHFDLIVSNPPYFSNGIGAPNLARRLGRTATVLTLEVLLDAVQKTLTPQGIFCTILPPTEGQRLCELAACCGLYCTQKTTVYSRTGKPAERLLLQFERSPYNFGQSSIVIFEEKKEHTAAFKQLTAGFYLDF